MENVEKLVDFFIEIEALKKTFRYSTLPENVRDSSADHSWKLAFMSSILDGEITGINSYRAVQICLVHDLAEAVTGDIDSYRILQGEITKEQKHKMEEEVVRSIKNKIPSVGNLIYNLWKEFEDNTTPEARYAHAMDKIEALIHLLHVRCIAREDNEQAGLTAKYADNAVKEFPQLQPLLDNIKLRLKKNSKSRVFNGSPIMTSLLKISFLK